MIAYIHKLGVIKWNLFCTYSVDFPKYCRVTFADYQVTKLEFNRHLYRITKNTKNMIAMYKRDFSALLLP